jgi:hypothetical protein
MTGSTGEAPVFLLLKNSKTRSDTLLATAVDVHPLGKGGQIAIDDGYEASTLG